MKGFIKGFFKWVLAGIGLGIGILVVIMALFYFDTKDKDTDASSDAENNSDINNSQAFDNEEFEFTTTFIPDEAESLNDEQNIASVNDDEIPVGYSLNEKGKYILNNPIHGSTWETVEDENITTTPRVYMPLTLFNCITDDDEMIRVDVINSDIGFMLKYYFATPDSKMNLQVQQPTEESYYSSFLNGTEIVMRAPDYFYRIAKIDKGGLHVTIVSAMSGKLINQYQCDDNSDRHNNFALLDRITPQRFKFMPLTDEVDDVLQEHFKNH